MTKPQYVQQPKFFSESDLNTLQQRAIEAYKISYNGVIRIAGPFKVFVENLEKAIREGREVNYRLPTMMMGSEAVAYVSKTNEEMEDAINQIKEKVEQDYRADIDAFNQAQIELLTKQLYEQEVNKERKKEEEKRTKQHEQAKKEAEDYFQSLINRP